MSSVQSAPWAVVGPSASRRVDVLHEALVHPSDETATLEVF